MPEDKVSDPITGQEIAFAHLVLSGAMTDHQAAEAVGLDPGSAASTKAKPCVHAYMLGHRAALQHEAKGQHRPKLDREHVLDRLWEISHLSPETTRGSVTGQVKALSIIVAMENYIPNRHSAAHGEDIGPLTRPGNLSIRLASRAEGRSPSHRQWSAANPSPCPERGGGPGTQPKPILHRHSL